MANIAIVAPTEFGGRNEECFRAGLASSSGGIPQPTFLQPNAKDRFFQSRGVYGITELRTLVRSAADTRPDLIVTVEGLVMAQAAALELRECDPRFVFLSGDALGWRPIALAGGVNLSTPSQDDARKSLLKSTFAAVDDSSMYLVVNNNSPVLPNEARSWPPARVARFFQDKRDNPRTNKHNVDKENNFIAEFEVLARREPRPSGLIIAADPYFRYFRTAFTKAVAKILPVPVCYPFQEFVDACEKTGNKENSIALNSPSLNSSTSGDETTALFQLGKQVGRYLSGTEDLGVVTWNGSGWELRPYDESSISQTSTHLRVGSGSEIELEALEIRVKGRAAETLLRDLQAALRKSR